MLWDKLEYYFGNFPSSKDVLNKHTRNWMCFHHQC